MYELFYTSLPRGLVPGTSGYTTVGHTSEMSRTLIEQAEKLSGYSFLIDDPTAYGREPVSWAHLRVGSGGQAAHVVSRIAACMPDYTGRSNYLAHHAFLTSQEVAACKAGPAALAATPGFLETQWQGEARFLPVRAAPAVMDRGPTTSAIESAGIDPGWAGALADRLRDRNMRQTFLVYSPGTNILGIVGDVLADLSPEERWQATFATHATKNFPGLGVECRLQCVVAGTPYAQDVLKRFPSDAFNLANLPSPPARVQRPRTAAAAGPRPSPATKPLMAPPGSATRSAKTETYATEPEQTFDLNTLRMPTIAQPPIETGSHGGFGSPLFLVPTVLAALMTIGCALLGYQWIQKGQQLADLTRRYDSLEGKHDDLKQQLDDEKKTLASVRKELEAKKEQVAVQAPAKTEVAAPKTELPKPNSEKEATDGKAAMTDAGDGGKPNPPQLANGSAAPQMTSPDLPALPGKDERVRPAPVRSMIPRVPVSLQADLARVLERAEQPASKSGKGKDKELEVKLVENMAGDPSGISLANKELCEILEAKIERKSPQSSWTVSVRKKTFASVKYEPSDHSLVIEFKNPDLLYLSRFVTLEITPKGQDKPLDIVLGAPLKAELHMEENKQAEPAKQKGIQTCSLFKDEAANALLDKMLEGFKVGLYESIEFSPDVGIESFSKKSKNLPPSMGKPEMPQNSFVLSQRDGSLRVGVVLMRKPQEPAVYQFHSFVIDPLQYGALANDGSFNGFWGPRQPGKVEQNWFFSEQDCQAITKNAQRDLDRLKDPEFKKAYPQAEAKLNSAKTADKAAFDQATKFVAETLLNKSHPVRFELRVPGSDVGFVLVDSLSTPGGGK
jgi:hypothetical protein